MDIPILATGWLLRFQCGNSADESKLAKVAVHMALPGAWRIR